MNCPEAREKIPLLAAEELESPEDLRKHLNLCKDCTDLHREMNGLHKLCSRTFRDARPSRPLSLGGKPTSTWTHPFRIAAVAAALLLALLLYAVVRRNGIPAVPPTVETPTENPPETAKNPPEPLPIPPKPDPSACTHPPG